jgi:hypothetical protein
MTTKDETPKLVPTIDSVKIVTSKYIPVGQIAYISNANCLAAWNGTAWLYIHEGNGESNFECLKRIRKENNW